MSSIQLQQHFRFTSQEGPADVATQTPASAVGFVICLCHEVTCLSDCLLTLAVCVRQQITLSPLEPLSPLEACDVAAASDF